MATTAQRRQWEGIAFGTAGLVHLRDPGPDTCVTVRAGARGEARRLVQRGDDCAVARDGTGRHHPECDLADE